MSDAYVSKTLRERVALQARYRCGYCLTLELLIGASVEIEHISILSVSAIGRATVATLRLNRPLLVRSRQVWVAAGFHPPKD